jgi:hypothetical protein
LNGHAARTGEAGVRVTVLRRCLPGLFASLVLFLAGCDNEAAADPSQWPAGAAGAVCQLLEYDHVAERIGVRFDTAGGGEKDGTATCALTQQGHDYPYLTLALTPSAADEVIFVATVQPSGATRVKGLGLIAYRLDVNGGGKAGPAVEFGWLSAKGRLMILRYAFGPGAAEADVDALVPKLLALAKGTEQPAAAG